MWTIQSCDKSSRISTLKFGKIFERNKNTEQTPLAKLCQNCPLRLQELTHRLALLVDSLLLSGMRSKSHSYTCHKRLPTFHQTFKTSTTVYSDFISWSNIFNSGF